MENRTDIKLLLLAGQMLLESGAETYRAEDAALYMFQALGQGDIHIFAVPTMMLVEVTDETGQTVSGYRRIRRRSTHLGKIEKINHVVRCVSKGTMTAEEALAALEAIDREPQGKLIFNLLATAASGGAFCLLLGGGLLECLFGFMCCFLAQLTGLFFRSVSMYSFFNSVLGGLVPSLVMLAAGRYLPELSKQVVIVGSMLPLFPGVATINAIRDAMNGDLLSGASRVAEALMIAMGLGIGASLIFLLGVA